MVAIGKVVAPHGVKGEIRVYPYSDFLSRCHHLKQIWLTGATGDDAFPVKVESAAIHKGMWVFSLDGYSDRDKAETLRGLMVQIPISERVSLPEGQFYLDEIIGLQVYETDGSLLGEVKDVLQPGGNDVYVVEGGARRVMVPAVKEMVKEIDLNSGKMIVDLPPGLKEL